MIVFDDTVCTPFPHDKTLLLWVTYKSETNQIWYITSNAIRTKYQLWKGKKKTKWESDNPLSLYDKIK